MSSLLFSPARTLLPPQHLGLANPQLSCCSPRKPPTVLLLAPKAISSDGEVDRVRIEAPSHDTSPLSRRHLLAATSLAGLLILSPSPPQSARADSPPDLSKDIPHKYSSEKDSYSAGRDPLDSVYTPPPAERKPLWLGARDTQPSSAAPKRTEIIAGLGSASTDTTLNSRAVRPSNRAEFAKQKNLNPEDVEEVLELKDVKLRGSSAVSLAVFINLPTAGSKTQHNIPEYVGSFSMLRPLIGPSLKSTKVNARFGISSNIRRLGIRDQSEIAVTLVAKGDSSNAKGAITVGGLKIVYE